VLFRAPSSRTSWPSSPSPVLVATILGVLASLNLRAETFARRATEYYVAMLSSLLGMFILASARRS